jgi:hypothetical protein
MTSRTARRWLIVPLLALALTALAACSSTGAATQTPTPTVTATPTAGFGGGPGGFGGRGPQLDATQMAAVMACLTEQGVEVPAGTTSMQDLFGAYPPIAGLQDALQGCAESTGIPFFNRGGGFGGGGFGGGNFSAFIQCLGNQGIDVSGLTAPGDGTPPPTTTPAPGTSGPLFGRLNPNDPAVAAAIEACGGMPGGRFGGPRSSTATPTPTP